MASIQIRKIDHSERLDMAMPISVYAFDQSPIDVAARYEKTMPYAVDRQTWVLFVDDRPMATATNIPMTQNVRGKIIPMGGVATVATLPQVRRKGYARQLLHELFKQMREQGQSVSTLYPFRESFYERMGYVGFPQDRLAHIKPANLSQALRFQPSGTVDFMNIRDGYEIYRDFSRQMQTRLHGFALHPDSWAARMRDQAGHWIAVAKTEDDIVGVMAYQLNGIFQPMHVWSFYYSSSVGKYLLLNWLARHVDQCSEIWMRLPSNAFIETWLHDVQAQIHSRLGADVFPAPTPMGRVVSVDGIGGIAVGEGSFSAYISDDSCDWNNGGYRFNSVDGQLAITSINPREVDCDLTIQGLSALVYGTHHPEDFYYRGWGDPDPEIQAVMHRMFPQAFPYLHEAF